MQKKHVKGVMASADTSVGLLQVTQAASETRVLTSGSTPKHGVPCFLYRNAVCQVDRLPGHGCISAYLSSRKSLLVTTECKRHITRLALCFVGASWHH